jgi:hypothetical protein
MSRGAPDLVSGQIVAKSYYPVSPLKFINYHELKHKKADKNNTII